MLMIIIAVHLFMCLRHQEVSTRETDQNHRHSDSMIEKCLCYAHTAGLCYAKEQWFIE